MPAGLESALDNLERDIEKNTLAIFKKVAEILRKKAKSHEDWGWDPSDTEEDRAKTVAHNAGKAAIRDALNEVADALDEGTEDAL